MGDVESRANVTGTHWKPVTMTEELFLKPVPLSPEAFSETFFSAPFTVK